MIITTTTTTKTTTSTTNSDPIDLQRDNARKTITKRFTKYVFAARHALKDKLDYVIISTAKACGFIKTASLRYLINRNVQQMKRNGYALLASKMLSLLVSELSR